LADFRGDSLFSTWLIRITLNQALMKLRKRRRAKKVSLDESCSIDTGTRPLEVTDWAANPEQLYGASELRKVLMNVMEKIRPILRTIFLLRDIEGLSLDETSEVLGLSHSAVKARLFRAGLQLRELLNKCFIQAKLCDRSALEPEAKNLAPLVGDFVDVRI
jgi:RNA polymerase sigma-70 factor, ECF subfamily